MAPNILDKSRLIISNFLQSPFSSALAAVDQIYFIVSYAALTLCDFNLMDPLIDQLQSFLMNLAPNEDHIAYRFSYVIAEFKRRYHDRAVSASAFDPPVAVKGSPFTDGVNHHQFIPSLLDTLPESYASMEQFVPGFWPTYSLAGALFQDAAMDVGIPEQMVQEQSNG